MAVEERTQEHSALGSSRGIAVLAVVLTLVLMAVFAVAYLVLSDAFKPAPHVSAHARNEYTETLHVVTDNDYEPFSYIDAEGEYAGLDVDLINEVANRLEMNLDLELLDWSECQERLRSGQADAILNMETDSIEADPSIIATIPTIEKQYVVYGREDVSSVDQLYGRRVASLHHLPGLGMEDSITYMGSYAEIFQALKDGEVDFAVCPVQVGNTFLEKLEIPDVHPSYAVAHIYGAIALASGNEALRDRLNAVIFELQREGYLDQLEATWVSHRYQATTLRGMVLAHPVLGAGFLVMLVLMALLLAFLMLQRRTTAAIDAHAHELQEKLDIIDRQAEELRIARDAAEASDRAKTVFLSNMSHDIRTPMNAIIGYTTIARRDDTSPEDVSAYLDKIGSSSKHLLALINDVLEMSRIESGKMELELERCNLVAMADELRDLFSTQMEGAGIEFVVDASGVEHRWVMADEARLNRVLLNLVSNALKFTPAGGTVRVCLSEVAKGGADAAAGAEPAPGADAPTPGAPDATPATATFQLVVSDTGIGMSPEFAERVFEAFERERTSTVSGIQGTGLGMAITKSIIDLMGGTIALDTEQGKGSTFTIRLALELAEGEPASAGGVAGLTEEAAILTDFSGLHVLIVEDNEINREIAQMLLEDEGFIVDCATNGQEGVDMLAAAEPHTYDFVLMDIQMPVLDGLGATAAIRAMDDPVRSRVPIIALSANAFAEDVRRALDAGMNAHAAKPLNMDELLATIGSILAPSSGRGDVTEE